jgi:hypothetical protein
MILTRELRDKIDDAWSYQAVSSCRWAMDQLDKFALTVLNNGKIEVEGCHCNINNLKDFFIWKKQDFGMSQIPVLRTIPYERLIDIINGLIYDFSIDQLSLKETDVNNHFFHSKFYSEIGEFDLEIGQIKSSDRFDGSTKRFKNLRFYFINEKHYRLTCEVETPRLLGLINGLEEKSIEFNRLEIR